MHSQKLSSFVAHFLITNPGSQYLYYPPNPICSETTSALEQTWALVSLCTHLKGTYRPISVLTDARFCVLSAHLSFKSVLAHKIQPSGATSSGMGADQRNIINRAVRSQSISHCSTGWVCSSRQLDEGRGLTAQKCDDRMALELGTFVYSLCSIGMQRSHFGRAYLNLSHIVILAEPAKKLGV